MRDESAQLALIVETQQAIATADGSFAELMAVVARRALALTDAAAAVVEVPQGDEMVYVAAAGAAAGYEGLRLRREGSLSGLCVREERTRERGGPRHDVPRAPAARRLARSR